MGDNGLKYSTVAVDYAEGVLDGTIVACQWIRLAAQRFIDDLHWQADDDFKFKYDAASAERACKFVERCPHTKGRWAAKRKRLVMEPWQVFLTCNIFGWVRKKNLARRFRTALLMVPRKNGKSPWAAAVGLYMLCADNEFGAEVYSGATNEKQAWEVFKPASLMASRSPAMMRKFGLAVNASNINRVKDASKFETIIGDPGDGASPSCAIIDEYHEHKTARMFDTMITGMGAREQPLVLVITTAGDNIAGPCYALQEQVEAMLLGTMPNDELFGMIFTIDKGDDWQDETSLEKANPNFDVAVSGDYLRSMQTNAINNIKDRATFQTKHLNIWVQSRDAYFDLEAWKDAGNEKLRMSDFADWECICGFDMGEKKDLTAATYLFRDKPGDDARYAMFADLYTPEYVIHLPENKHLLEWQENGELKGTPGKITDQRVAQADIEANMAEYDIRELVFDVWHSRQLAVLLAENGASCIEFATRPSNMNEPMRNMDALIAEGRIVHNGSKALSWMMGNVVNGGRKATTDLHRPDKEKPEKKIDAPVAGIMALGRFLLDEGDDVITIPDDYSPGL